MSANNVYVTITGTQHVDNDEPVEITEECCGCFAMRGKIAKLLYKDVKDKDNDAVGKKCITVKENVFFLRYNESDRNELVVEEGKKHEFYYRTPEGILPLTTKGLSFACIASRDEVKITLKYELYNNGQYISLNDMVIRITPKKGTLKF